MPTLEPTPALRTFFDLPLRLKLDEDLSSRVEAVEADARALDQRTGEWLPIYERAIAVSEEVAESLDRDLRAVQDALHEMPDPGRVRQEIAGSARKEADQARVRLRTDLQALVREWADRAKRQQDQVSRQCTDAAAGELRLAESATDRGIELAVNAPWWAQFAGFVQRCADVWADKVTEGVEQALQSRVAELSALPIAGGQPVSPPSAPTPPRFDPVLHGPPKPESADLPSVFGALGSFVRSNLMMVSMFSAMVLGGGVASKGKVLLAALPFIAAGGWFAGKKQRARLKDKALRTARGSVESQLARDLKSGLDAWRGALDRHVQARVKEWEAAVDAWGEQTVRIALEDADAAAEGRIRELRREVGALQERQSSLKANRSQVGKNLLFDLRRRERDLKRTG